jgi:branched-chain amino acid transport system ATP-binding protein
MQKEQYNYHSYLFKADHVSKRFGGLKAINCVSFHINEREIVGLIGPNGAGKTTLFNLITGFYQPNEGQFYFKGKNINGFKPFQICHKGIGRTFQIVRPLKSLSVLENIVTASLLRHSSYNEAKRKALEIAQLVKLENKLDKIAGSVPIPDKKRLGFAQALATGAQLLLLDEVAAGLNPKEIDQFLAIIKLVSKQGIAIIMVEHVMRAVMNIAQRILVLDHGELIAEGTPKDISTNEKVIKAYLGDDYAL